jgi:hypothetical protein
MFQCCGLILLYRWQQAQYLRVEGFRTRTREVNFVPAPATHHGQEIVLAPATRGHTRPPAARQQASAPWGCKHIEALPLERNEIEALGCVGATGRRRSGRGNASCRSACRIEIPALGERQRPADNQRNAGERRTVERTTCRRRCGVVGNGRSWGRGRREGRRSGCACSVGGSVLWGLEERLRPEAGAGGGQERGRDSRGCVARIALAGSGR